MKRLMKVKTNASTMFVTYDTASKEVRVLDSLETNGNFPLSDVEDDSSWDVYEGIEDVEEWLGVYENTDATEIIEERTFD